MPALLALLLPALLPVFSDGIRGVVGMFTKGKGANPQNVEEAVKLMAAEVEKLKAVAALDQPAANISPWVADLRASFRYIAAGAIVITTLGCVLTNNAYTPLMLELAGPVYAFIFGERMYLKLKNGG